MEQKEKQLSIAYRLLGVEKSSSDDSIKLAYRRMALKFHPDKNPDSNTTDTFQKISAAYQLIVSSKMSKLPHSKSHNTKCNCANMQKDEYPFQMDPQTFFEYMMYEAVRNGAQSNSGFPFFMFQNNNDESDGEDDEEDEEDYYEESEEGERGWETEDSEDEAFRKHCRNEREAAFRVKQASRSIAFQKARDGSFNEVKNLIDTSAIVPQGLEFIYPPNSSKAYDECFIHIAARKNDLKFLKFLLKYPCLNEVDSKGRSVLHLCSEFNSFKVASSLLQTHSAFLDIDLKDNEGFTALGIAARLGYHEMVSLLLNHNSNINIRQKGKTILNLVKEARINTVHPDRHRMLTLIEKRLAKFSEDKKKKKWESKNKGKPKKNSGGAAINAETEENKPNENEISSAESDEVVPQGISCGAFDIFLEEKKVSVPNEESNALKGQKSKVNITDKNQQKGKNTEKIETKGPSVYVEKKPESPSLNQKTQKPKQSKKNRKAKQQLSELIEIIPVVTLQCPACDETGFTAASLDDHLENTCKSRIGDQSEDDFEEIGKLKKSIPISVVEDVKIPSSSKKGAKRNQIKKEVVSDQPRFDDLESKVVLEQVYEDTSTSNSSKFVVPVEQNVKLLCKVPQPSMFPAPPGFETDQFSNNRAQYQPPTVMNNHHHHDFLPQQQQSFGARRFESIQNSNPLFSTHLAPPIIDQTPIMNNFSQYIGPFDFSRGQQQQQQRHHQPPPTPVALAPPVGGVKKSISVDGFFGGGVGESRLKKAMWEKSGVPLTNNYSFLGEKTSIMNNGFFSGFGSLAEENPVGNSLLFPGGVSGLQFEESIGAFPSSSASAFASSGLPVFQNSSGFQNGVGHQPYHQGFSPLATQNGFLQQHQNPQIPLPTNGGFGGVRSFQQQGQPLMTHHNSFQQPPMSFPGSNNIGFQELANGSMMGGVSSSFLQPPISPRPLTSPIERPFPVYETQPNTFQQTGLAPVSIQSAVMEDHLQPPVSSGSPTEVKQPKNLEKVKVVTKKGQTKRKVFL